MSLSLSLDVIRNSLATTAEQTALVSRNIAHANDPTASRKSAEIVTMAGGAPRLSAIRRASNDALFDKMLGATSSAATHNEIVDALNRLDWTVDDPELDVSPAALIQKLSDSLQQYAIGPQDISRAGSTIATANTLANSLNDATRLVQQVRSQADADINASVTRLNELLSRFETLNTEIVKGSRSGADITDYLDQRDQVLAGISEEVGIRTMQRSNGDIAIFTDSGVTLFDIKARNISFDRTMMYDAGTVGNQILADGVPITGGNGTMNITSGRLTGLVAVRDEYAVGYQNQLDEIARGLIEAFAEKDQSATPTLPDAAGLFTYSGGPGIPPSGSVIAGLAGDIRVNASVDPNQGGDLSLLRDGGIAGNPAYVYNDEGGAGYTGRLDMLIDSLTADRAFDASGHLSTQTSLTSYAAASVGWLQEGRKIASDQGEYSTTLLERSSDALSKATGVNIEEETILMLDLERSYQAASKLLSTIDSMLAALLEAAG